MKKLMNGLLVLMLCLGLAACGRNDSSSDNQNHPQNSDIEVQEDETSNDTQDHQNEGDSLDESFSQFVGVWYSYHYSDTLIEIYEDGRIVWNGSVEYTAKNYDGEMFEVYLGDKWYGYGYIYEEFSDPDNPCLSLETPEDTNLLGWYTRAPK